MKANNKGIQNWGVEATFRKSRQNCERRSQIFQNKITGLMFFFIFKILQKFSFSEPSLYCGADASSNIFPVTL